MYAHRTLPAQGGKWKAYASVFVALAFVVVAYLLWGYLSKRQENFEVQQDAAAREEEAVSDDVLGDANTIVERAFKTILRRRPSVEELTKYAALGSEDSIIAALVNDFKVDDEDELCADGWGDNAIGPQPYTPVDYHGCGEDDEYADDGDDGDTRDAQDKRVSLQVSVDASLDKLNDNIKSTFDGISQGIKDVDSNIKGVGTSIKDAGTAVSGSVKGVSGSIKDSVPELNVKSSTDIKLPSIPVDLKGKLMGGQVCLDRKDVIDRLTSICDQVEQFKQFVSMLSN
jgi:hypothetical protein